jgi:hypothetical protein
MKPVIYIRTSLAEQDELLAAKKYFEVVEQRTHIKQNSLVIPRYSALPYYKELENDVQYIGSKLINSYREHNYVANIRNWYYDLADITPRTWFYLDQIEDKDGPFVLKGSTNSKKHAFNTMMYAENKREAGEVFYRLSQDSMIGVQDIVVRKFVPLNKLMDGLNGLPISEEYRFFVLNGKVIAKGFYWSNIWDDLEIKPDVNSVPSYFISTILEKIDNKIPFYVFDVARKADGNWILIELNCGAQAGLSIIDPEEFYFNLKKELETI